MLAARNRHTDAVALLLEAAPGSIHLTDKLGGNAFAYSLSNGGVSNPAGVAIAQVLVARGVSMSTRYHFGQFDEKTHTYTAASSGHFTTPFIHWLCSTAPSQKDFIGHCASVGGDFDGAHSKDEDGDEVPAPIIFDKTLDRQQTDSCGRTALMWAAKVGSRFNNIATRNSGGGTLPAVLDYLLRSVGDGGKDALSHLLLAEDHQGETCLHHACKEHNETCVAVFLLYAGRAGCLDQLLQHTSGSGDTALSIAAPQSDNNLLVSLLLSRTAPATLSAILATRNKEDRTCLDLAVMSNSTATVKAILANRPLRPDAVKCTLPANAHPGEPLRFSLAIESHGVQVAVVQERNQHDKTEALRYEKTFIVPKDSGPGLCLDIPVDITAFTNPTNDFLRGLPFHQAECKSGKAFDYGVCAGEDSEDNTTNSAAMVDAANARGQTALHLCVNPRAFGSYENTTIATLLLSAGASISTCDNNGETPATLARQQRSGNLARCMASIAGTEGDGMVTDPPLESALAAHAGVGVAAVDIDADIKAMFTACAQKDASKKEDAMAVDSAAAAVEAEKEAAGLVADSFEPPADSSRCVVLQNEDDGSFWDLIMTKCDVASGRYGKNVFYKMQVIHELNQDLYMLFTNWGRIGDVHSQQHQSTPFPSAEAAVAEFCKIFKSKARNEWSSRSAFTKMPGYYQYHAPSKQKSAKDQLTLGAWTRLPSKLPLSLQRFFNVVSHPPLLERTLSNSAVNQDMLPLGQLALSDSLVAETFKMLTQIRKCIVLADAERYKDMPDSTQLQKWADEIMLCSSRYFELVPHNNFSHANVGPLNTVRLVDTEVALVELLSELQVTCRILLGAQSQIERTSPIDYIYCAAQCTMVELAHDSAEMASIQEYINQSQPGACLLHADTEAPAVYHDCVCFQAVEDIAMYTTSDCTTKAASSVAPGVVFSSTPALWGVFKTQGSTSLKVTAGSKVGWVPNTEAGKFVAISHRVAQSTVSAVYKVRRTPEVGRAQHMAELGNRQLLFHGTRVGNAVSLLASGLRVNPPGVVRHGSMYGEGVYFANKFAKSLTYSSEYHNGTGLMLLCEVACGNVYEIKHGEDFAESVKLARAEQKIQSRTSAQPTSSNAGAANDGSGEHDEDATTLSGTPYDSMHVLTASTPDKTRTIFHPHGYTVPLG